MKQTRETGIIAIRLLVVIALVLGQLTIAASAYSEEGLDETNLEEIVEEAPDPDPDPSPTQTEQEPELEDTNLESLSLGTPTVWTDKDDYAPNEMVTVSGSGWQPEEAIHLFVNDDEGETWNHHADVIADLSGGFIYEFDLPNWFVATYTIVTTGELSGTVTTTFTDSHVENGCGATSPLVVSTTDDLVGGGAASTCSLREAIIAANAHVDITGITLPAGTYSLTVGPAGDDNAATGDLDVRADLTITGADESTTIIQAGTLDTNGIDRVFEVRNSGTDLVLDDLTVRHGRTSSNGAGIHVENTNATLTTNNVVVTANNSTSGQGGGIFSKGNVTLNGSTVSHSSAGNEGGGIFMDDSNRTLTLNDSAVSDNSTTASGKDGGGIYAKGTANLNDSIVTDNTARGHGGGIYTDSSDRTLTLNGSNVSGNSTTDSSKDGGGIYAKGNVTMDLSSVSDNSATGHGGGIFMENSSRTLTMTDSTVSDNSATGSSKNGGGVRSIGIMNISRSTVSGNTASGNGGGVWSDSGGTNVLANTTVTNNTSVNGGGLFVTNGTSNLYNVTVSHNNATTSSSPGDGIRRSGGTVNLRNTILANNDTANCSGAPNNIHNNLDSGTGCFVAVNSSQTGVDPLLGALQDNGGPTWTRALGAGSPAIDMANDATCAAAPVSGVDQRGVARPQGDHCDIGAYEFDGAGGTSATITVTKVWSDASDEAVTINVVCDTGELDQASADIDFDPDDSATFEVADFGESETCTVEEDEVPAGYTVSYGDDCDSEGVIEVEDEGTYDCTVTNTLNSATFTVSKEYSDTNTNEVTIKLDCDGGSVAPSAEETTDALEVEFTVTGFEDGVDSCTVAEDPVPSGYTASYDGDCDEVTLEVDGAYECTVTNTLNSADVTVSKDFSDDSTDEVDISLDCGDADVDPASDKASEATAAEFTVTGFEDDDTCTVEEDVPSGYTASFEDTEDDCDADGVITLAVGGEYACEITNTLNVTDLTVYKEYSDGNIDEVTINVACDSGEVTPSEQEDTVGLEVTFTITGFATGDTCTATEDEVPAGYAANDADCAGVELTPGTPASCTIYNVQSIALVSQGSCSFDRDDTRGGPDHPEQQFPLIYTPDSGSTWKLNASNPGQFFLNVAYSGVSEDLEIEIPYPFVTVGANPVRVYGDVTTRVNGAGKTCFSPDGLIRTQDDQITWDWGTDDFGDEESIGVDVPESGFVYVRIHLTYGLKRIATSCGKGTVEAGLTALDAVCANPLNGGATIKTYQPYDFSFYGDTADGGETIESFNVFKRDPGIGGQLTLGSNGDPLGNTKVEIWLDGNKVDTLTTDVDGWYISPFKHKGKAATYKVKLPTYGEEKSASVKANTFVIVNFDVGSILSEPPPDEGGGDGGGGSDGGTTDPPEACVPKGKSKNCA